MGGQRQREDAALLVKHKDLAAKRDRRSKEIRRQKKARLRKEEATRTHGGGVNQKRKSKSPPKSVVHGGRWEKQTPDISFPNLGAKRNKNNAANTGKHEADESDSSSSNVELDSDFALDGMEEDGGTDTEVLDQEFFRNTVQDDEASSFGASGKSKTKSSVVLQGLGETSHSHPVLRLKRSSRSQLDSRVVKRAK